MSEVGRRKPLTLRVGRWFGELLLVFLGTYAAFWLNNYQQHRQDAKRRDQILGALEEYVQLAADESARNAATAEKHAREFDRALAAGEMPPLGPINWTTDYSPTDIATYLQAGGLDLLDVKTLSALRNADSITRGFLSSAMHDQKLSDELIVPNLDQDISFFYDPTTKQLRKRFAVYPVCMPMPFFPTEGRRL
jgi:hypothetical protein